jgi:sugar phosphate isomerase/epimerase
MDSVAMVLAMIGCSTLSFTHRPLAEALGTIAKLGFSGWELPIRGDKVHLGHIDPDVLIADPACAAGVRTAQAVFPQLRCLGAGFELSRKSPLDREVKLFDACCALLAELKAPAVTVFLFDDGAAPCVERYRALKQAAQARGLRLQVETHVSTATANPERALELCKELDLALTLDASHYLRQNYGIADIVPLAPFVRHVQIRGCNPGILECPTDGKAERALHDAILPSTYAGDVVVEYINRDKDWTESFIALRDAFRPT